jgi:hypothetical protein
MKPEVDISETHRSRHSEATASRPPTMASVPAAPVDASQLGIALDPLEEALLELARSALRNRREVAERRGKMALVDSG